MNLENFVEQVRHNSFHKVDDSDNNELNYVDQSKMTVLEEAVRNLRELDVNRDFESQYWETLRSSKGQLIDESLHEFEKSIHNERSSLDATILQKRINYVSLFLNNSTISPTISSGNENRRSSVSEQSAFIEELARKYLNKASTKLETFHRSDKQYLCDTTQTSNNFSIGTEEYFRRHNLNDVQNGVYYSSIRKPDGNSLPRSKHLISSTPATRDHLVRDINCFKKPENIYRDQDDSNWSHVKILEGLKQQPSILPARNQDSIECLLERKADRYVYSEEMVNVLDIDKLKQLPKYL